MTTTSRLLAVLAAVTLAASSAMATPGGQGQGGGHGDGGNSASAGSQGAAASAAARDKSTAGVAKALSVVGTTPASPQASLSLQAVLDKFLAREGDSEGEVTEGTETVE